MSENTVVPRKTVWRTYWIWQYEEEEAWLNQMAAEGWVLEEVHFFRYVFGRCQPGEYAVRLELLSGGVNKEKNQEYIWFVRGTGAEYIGNLKQWVYFRKKTAEGPFELFSDLDSRLTHVERVLLLMGTLLPIFFVNMMNILRLSLSSEVAEGTRYGMLVAYAAVLIWLGRGFWKLWKLRKKIKEERNLRE